MRKTVNIFLLLTYLTFTVGVTVSYGFCSEEIQSVKLVLAKTSSDSDCNCCGMCGTDCCKTEIKTTKIEDSQNTDVSKINSSEKVLLAVLPIEQVNLNSASQIYNITTNNSSPPLSQKILLQKYSFLI